MLDRLLRWRAVTGRPQLLVFDGCYHGAVDDTLVDRDPATGSTVRAGHRCSARCTTTPISRGSSPTIRPMPERALAWRQVGAALLAEPALTNFGLVPPEPGFWPAAQALCRRRWQLLVLDETHTLSSGVGGHARARAGTRRVGASARPSPGACPAHCTA